MKKILFLSLLFLFFNQTSTENKIIKNQTIYNLAKYNVSKAITPSFSAARRALFYTNQFRAQNGRPALVWNDKMAKLARHHSTAMAKGTRPFGHAFFARRVSRFGFPVAAAGENVFAGSVSGDIARAAVNAWINSPGHRANLLGNYTLCGIGAVQNARGIWYFTQELARPA